MNKQQALTNNDVISNVTKCGWTERKKKKWLPDELCVLIVQ